jgi:hypothetical protein
MEFAQALCAAWFSQHMLADKIPCLVLKVVETGICRELFSRHGELPFVYPRSAQNGLKVSSVELRSSWVDFCPFRGPDAPHALIESIAGKKTWTQACKR